MVAAEGLIELPQFFPGQGDYPRAAQAYEEAAKLCPEDGDIFFNLALTRKKLGQFDKAFSCPGVIALFKKNDSQIIIGGGRLRGYSYDAGKPVGRLIEFSFFEKKQRQEVVELRVILIISEQGLIAGQGLLKISGLVMMQGLGKEVHGILLVYGNIIVSEPVAILRLSTSGPCSWFQVRTK
ncbi:MAG: tetratricopeptide repeat protein [Proteobacteria bacterium]|nr:tetratricopeptide repeat protein [Pseudomonadota bacterium]